MGRKGRTKVPCPGCGESRDYPFRLKNEVCDNCKNDLHEIERLRKEIAERKDMVNVLVGDMSYFNDGFYDVIEMDSNLRESLSKDYFEVVRSVGLKPPLNPRDIKEEDRKRVYADPPNEGHEENALVLQMTLREQRALLKLNADIKMALSEAFDVGLKKGSNLLVALADNTISPTLFNQTTGRSLTDDERKLYDVLPTNDFFISSLDYRERSRARWQVIRSLWSKGYLYKHFDVERREFLYRKVKGRNGVREH